MSGTIELIKSSVETLKGCFAFEEDSTPKMVVDILNFAIPTIISWFFAIFVEWIN